MSILSRKQALVFGNPYKERERGAENEREDGRREVLTISGSEQLWGQIIGLRPITRRRRYIEESGCRRVPRIVLPAKNKIPPGSGDYVPKKEESAKRSTLLSCMQVAVGRGKEAG